jgi:predicted enzyme related to lactoylglutathione lyase
MATEFLGLRSSIYSAPNLAESKAWWTKALAVEPYFDEPFYVGFDLGGYELGLNPDMPLMPTSITYWGVRNVQSAIDSLTADGATVIYGPTEVGGGIVIADLQASTGEVFGIIDNPHFAARN